MNKKLFFAAMLIPTLLFSFSRVRSIHYSADNTHLVDERGNLIHVTGHPWTVCYIGDRTLSGWFVKESHGQVILETRSDYTLVDRPVCDLYYK